MWGRVPLYHPDVQSHPVPSGARFRGDYQRFFPFSVGRATRHSSTSSIACTKPIVAAENLRRIPALNPRIFTTQEPIHSQPQENQMDTHPLNELPHATAWTPQKYHKARHTGFSRSLRPSKFVQAVAPGSPEVEPVRPEGIAGDRSKPRAIVHLTG